MLIKDLLKLKSGEVLKGATNFLSQGESFVTIAVVAFRGAQKAEA